MTVCDHPHVSLLLVGNWPKNGAKTLKDAERYKLKKKKLFEPLAQGGPLDLPGTYDNKFPFELQLVRIGLHY